MTMVLLMKIVAVVLTLMVLSRIVADNPLFRIAQYLFVGVSLGYAFVVLYHQVLWPAVARVLNNVNVSTLNTTDAELWIVVAPFALGLLLLPRILGRQRFSWLANIPLALLFGAGAALAVGGVLIGTLVPQMRDTVQPTGVALSQMIGSVVLALGVLLTLSYFYFTGRRDTNMGQFVSASGQIGRWLLMVAFGFFLAGALRTYLAALIERVGFLINWSF